MVCLFQLEEGSEEQETMPGGEGSHKPVKKCVEVKVGLLPATGLSGHAVGVMGMLL